MDLQSFQYQMWLAVKKHQALVGRRQQEPHNLALQKEIYEVLYQLVSINENQKLVVAKLREERESERLKEGSQVCKEEIDLLCEEEMLQDDQTLLPPPGLSPPTLDHDHHLFSDSPTTPPDPDLYDHCIQSPGCEGEGGGEGSDGCGGWWCSPEKRLHTFHPPTADYSQEDIHDLVTEEEFMHALGLLTVREWEEVLAKRHERRKHTVYAHIFSSKIWEKPETKRKRRQWLASGAGSPPTLRRKVRPPSQPPSRPPSRPASPGQSSCSPVTTLPPFSQPPSPQSLEEDEPTPSQEICPMCKVKGADVQCDGCGVIYHAACVDLGDRGAPLGWLCLTCEQLGLRASTHSDSHHYSRRREALAVRERLLRQRAELTITKLQLEERKSHLSRKLQAQTSERTKLQKKEDGVRQAIKKLHAFIHTFQQPLPDNSLPLKSSPESTSENTPVPSQSMIKEEEATSSYPSPQPSPSSTSEPYPPPYTAFSPPSTNPSSPSSKVSFRSPNQSYEQLNSPTQGHNSPDTGRDSPDTGRDSPDTCRDSPSSTPTPSFRPDSSVSSPTYAPSPACPPTYTSTYTCSLTSKSSTITPTLIHQSSPEFKISSSVSRRHRPPEDQSSKTSHTAHPTPYTISLPLKRSGSPSSVSRRHRPPEDQSETSPPHQHIAQPSSYTISLPLKRGASPIDRERESSVSRRHRPPGDQSETSPPHQHTAHPSSSYTISLPLKRGGSPIDLDLDRERGNLEEGQIDQSDTPADLSIRHKEETEATETDLDMQPTDLSKTAFRKTGIGSIRPGDREAVAASF